MHCGSLIGEIWCGIGVSKTIFFFFQSRIGNLMGFLVSKAKVGWGLLYLLCYDSCLNEDNWLVQDCIAGNQNKGRHNTNNEVERMVGMYRYDVLDRGVPPEKAKKRETL